MDLHIYAGFKPSCHDLHFTYFTFERIFCEQHKVKKHSQCPNIDRNSIIRVADDLGSHIFLSSTMGLRPHTSDRPRKAKISNFIGQFVSFFLQKNILRLDISMYEIFLMNTLQSLHDLHDNFSRMFKRKNLCG